MLTSLIRKLKADGYRGRPIGLTLHLVAAAGRAKSCKENRESTAAQFSSVTCRLSSETITGTV